MSTTEMEQRAEAIARDLAADVVQSIADSMPEDETIEAQDLLRGTPVEHLFCLDGDVIARFVEAAISNAIHDGALALPSPESPESPTLEER